MAKIRRKKASRGLNKSKLFPLIFIAIFACAGIYLLIRSMAAADPRAGIWMVWGDVATVNKPFVKGGQAVIEWTDLRQAGDSAYHWDANSFKWTGFADINNFGGKPFTVQVNSNFKLPCDHGAAGCSNDMNPNLSTAANPDNRAKKWFGYGPNIAWCGKYDPAADSSVGGAYRFDVPQFWNTTKTDLNPTYMGHLEDMISNFSAHVTTSSFPKDRILGVRTAPNFIGTEHSGFADSKITNIPGTTICNRAGVDWSAISNRADAASIALYKKYFYSAPHNTGIKPIFRGEYLDATIPANKQLFFNTNASPDETNHFTSSDLYYTKARNGTYQSYYEPFNKSERYISPVTWNYWLILGQLHRGVNYIAVYGDDLKKAGNDPCTSNTASILGTTGIEAVEYRMAYCFANKYAAYANNQNSADKAKTSPGAWIAFTRNELSPDNSGYLNMYMTGSSIEGNRINQTSSPANIAFIQTTVSVKQNIAAQGGSMGNPTQRYGRFARIINPSQALNVRLNTAFKDSLGSSLKVNVTYLDTGSGSVTLAWGTTSDKKATFSKSPAPTNNWVTKTVIISKSALSTNGDLKLTTTGGNTTFHMIEVVR